jgi:hypothetical protein
MQEMRRKISHESLPVRQGGADISDETASEGVLAWCVAAAGSACVETGVNRRRGDRAWRFLEQQKPFRQTLGRKKRS